MIRAPHVFLAATLVAGATLGCAWLVGVSEDPVVAALADGDAAVEPDTPSSGDSSMVDASDAEKDALADADADEGDVGAE